MIKKEYVLHKQILNQPANYGLVLKKVHGVINLNKKLNENRFSI